MKNSNLEALLAALGVFAGTFLGAWQAVNRADSWVPTALKLAQELAERLGKPGDTHTEEIHRLAETDAALTQELDALRAKLLKLETLLQERQQPAGE